MMTSYCILAIVVVLFILKILSTLFCLGSHQGITKYSTLSNELDDAK